MGALTRRRRSVVGVAVVVVFVGGMAVGAGLARPQTSGHDVDPLVAEAESKIASQAAHPISRPALDQAAIEGMLAALDDRWATYYSPSGFAQFQGALNGGYTGVGLWVRREAGSDVVRVASVDAGSPAAGAGVQVGDVLVAVNGAPVAGSSVADVVTALRGAPGTTLALVLERSGVTWRLTLRRAAVADDDMSARTIAPGVVLLRVAAFTRGVGRWVRAEVAALQARRAAGIVLDLRADPGGLLDEAVETASAFLPGGRVVSFTRRGAPPQVINAVGRGDTLTPLVVLVDGGTASAAEIVAGALQDRGRAVLVGSRTFGKGSVQVPTRLSDGSGFELTVGRYETPSGRSVDGVGISPDVEVAPGAPPGVAEQRAVEVLSGMVADAGTAGGG